MAVVQQAQAVWRNGFALRRNRNGDKKHAAESFWFATSPSRRLQAMRVTIASKTKKRG